MKVLAASRRVAICFFVLSWLASCATITRGTEDVLVVESDPSGATVTLSNGMTGSTPTSFSLPRKHSVIILLELEGYENSEVRVTPRVSGAGSAGMAGNVLLGGLIGAAIDGGSGAMKDLVPNPVFVRLKKLGGAESSVD